MSSGWLTPKASTFPHAPLNTKPFIILMTVINFTSLLVFIASTRFVFIGIDELSWENQFCSFRTARKNQLRNGSNLIIIIKIALVMFYKFKLPFLKREEGKRSRQQKYFLPPPSLLAFPWKGISMNISPSVTRKNAKKKKDWSRKNVILKGSSKTSTRYHTKMMKNSLAFIQIKVEI